MAAKPPSPIPLQLFGPQQQALFDALVATAKAPPEPPSASPPKTRAAVKARPAKKNEGQDMEVDTTVDAKKPRAARKPRAPKRKKLPEDETTASDDSNAEVRRKKKAVVKDATVLKKQKSGSKVSNTFYKDVANDVGDLSGQDVKNALLATQKVLINGLKENGKARISSFLTFKLKALKERPAKAKSMFGNIVTLKHRPAKKVALNKSSKAKQNAAYTISGGRHRAQRKVLEAARPLRGRITPARDGAPPPVYIKSIYRAGETRGTPHSGLQERRMPAAVPKAWLFARPNLPHLPRHGSEPQARERGRAGRD